MLSVRAMVGRFLASCIDAWDEVRPPKDAWERWLMRPMPNPEEVAQFFRAKADRSQADREGVLTAASQSWPQAYRNDLAIPFPPPPNLIVPTRHPGGADADL